MHVYEYKSTAESDQDSIQHSILFSTMAYSVDFIWTSYGQHEGKRCLILFGANHLSVRKLYLVIMTSSAQIFHKFIYYLKISNTNESLVEAELFGLS